jgi:hypothetical protein
MEGQGFMHSPGVSHRGVVKPCLEFTVIACDKRGAFAQGSESDEAIRLSCSLPDGLLRWRSQ